MIFCTVVVWREKCESVPILSGMNIAFPGRTRSPNFTSLLRRTLGKNIRGGVVSQTGGGPHNCTRGAHRRLPRGV